MDDLLTPEEAAVLVAEWRQPKLTAQSLIAYSKRKRGAGPPLAVDKPGARQYRRADVLDWCLDQMTPKVRRLVVIGRRRPFAKLTADGVVKLNLWAAIEAVIQNADQRLLLNMIAREAEARDWPEGWYEDPSVIPEMGDG